MACQYTIAAIIVNYNMPERADALYTHIRNKTTWPVDVYLVDNGSDITRRADNTNVRLDKNVQTTNGWLAGLQAARRKGEYYAYWFLITSAEFVDNRDPLSPMAEFLVANREAVAIHPALTLDSTTVWEHMITQGGNKPRQTWHVDNIASLYRSRWYDIQGGFDRQLTYAHGIDLEMCYKARRDARTIYIDERRLIKKVTNIGYTMGRMNMTADDRLLNARAEMDKVLTPRYGPEYWNVLINGYR